MSAHQQGGEPFGLASLPPAALAEVTGAAVGRAVRAPRARATVIPYDSRGSPATAGLWRVEVSGRYAGAAGQDDRAPGPVRCTYFVKLLRHPRRWPGLAYLPDQATRDEFVNFFPWRVELGMYQSGIAAGPPPRGRGPPPPPLHRGRAGP